jgi:hypothetical protein
MFEIPNHPHPRPLPEYRERGQDLPIDILERYTLGANPSFALRSAEKYFSAGFPPRRQRQRG